MDTRTVSMESKGIMQEIREHLADGQSSGEVIAMGYAPPTVYKVQRWMRRNGQLNDGAAVAMTMRAPVHVADPMSGAKARGPGVEDEQLQTEVEALVSRATYARMRAHELEAENEQLEAHVTALQGKLTEADAVASELAQVNGRAQVLEFRVESLSRRLEESKKDCRLTEDRLAETQKKLVEAERKLREATDEIAGLSAYLSSKTCGWREDFARFKQHRSLTVSRCTASAWPTCSSASAR